MPSRVFLVGVGRRVIELGIRGAIQADLAVVAAEARRYVDVTVLGCDVVERTHPRDAWRSLRANRATAILCADECPASALVPWVLQGFGMPVAIAELRDAIGGAARRPRRPRLDPSAYLAHAPPSSSRAGRCLALIPDLPRITVQDWCARSGLTIRTLASVCHREVGLSPKAVLLSYVAVAARELRSAGVDADDAAEVLGYYDRPTLRRAERRA